MKHEDFRRELALLMLKAPNKHKATLYDLFSLFGVATEEEDLMAQYDSMKSAFLKFGEALNGDKSSCAYKEWRKQAQKLNLHNHENIHINA